MIGRYISHICSIRRYSERTREIYRGVLEDFAAFCNASTEGRQITECLSVSNIRNYEVYLLDDCHNKPSTVNLHISVLSGFCRFLIKEGYLTVNPVHQLPRPKTERRLPEFYREEAMETYFKVTDNYVYEDDFGMRSRYEARLRRAIVSILYNTGIRRSELISLKIGSIDFGRKVIIVKGKGDKMREIPIVSSLCNEISLYLQSVEKMVGCERTPASPLLITFNGRALYPVFVDRTVKRELSDVEGITGRKSPHVLRHTLATELLNDGTDLNSIKELLGHSSLAATQVYTHNSIEKLKKVYNQAHPRAKSGGNNGD